MAEIKSGKVKKTPPTEVSPGRYEFLGLSEAEPDLGVPAGNGYVLTSSAQGVRTWADFQATVAYTYNQLSPSATWNITHNLNFYPNVTIIDSAGTTVEGDVEYVSTNTITVSFSAGFSGVAYLS